MTANMAICRTSIHTSPATNTAQHIPKFRGQHLRTPVIDNNQMKLFRTINVPRFAWSCQPVLYPVKRAPTALRASMVINTSTSANVGAIRSIPITAICVLGSVVHIRALPSLVTVHTEPVSATAKLQPVIPISALRKSSRIFAE